MQTSHSVHIVYVQTSHCVHIHYVQTSTSFENRGTAMLSNLLFHDPGVTQGRRQCVTAANLATGSRSSRSRWQDLTVNDATGGFWQPGTQHLHWTHDYMLIVECNTIGSKNALYQQQKWRWSEQKHSKPSCRQLDLQFAMCDETNNRYYTFPWWFHRDLVIAK